MGLKIIGRTDLADFPKLGLFQVDIKIDTGAYTSAIHCSEVEEKNNKLYCTFYSKGHPNFSGKQVVFNKYTRTDVKSSNGFLENRFKIKSSIILFDKVYTINLTLSTRDDMKFPVLIGRQFLNKKFLVDVGAQNLSFNNTIYEHYYSIPK